MSQRRTLRFALFPRRKISDQIWAGGRGSESCGQHLALQVETSGCAQDDELLRSALKDSSENRSNCRRPCVTFVACRRSTSLRTLPSTALLQARTLQMQRGEP